MTDKDAILKIDPNYPMPPGEWDVYFLNPETTEKILIRVALTRLTMIKDLFSLHDGDIVSVKRVR